MTKEDVLKKVRALLAQAESTTFPAEAESFTAKAEELIARHAIELHLVHAQAGTREEVESRIVTLVRPFTRPKVVLLNQIASHYRVVVIAHVPHKSSFPTSATMYGFPSDLDTVEMLWTSLLIQLAYAANRARFDGNAAQVMSQRTSFLYGFASRVGARLARMNRKVEDSAPGSALVLRDRKLDVDAFVAANSGPTKTNSTKIKDRAAYVDGVRAADQADLGQDRIGRNKKEIA